MAAKLMLFVNNNCGKSNQTINSDTFVSKYMVNVNAFHKEAFILWYYQRNAIMYIKQMAELFTLD